MKTSQKAIRKQCHESKRVAKELKDATGWRPSKGPIMQIIKEELLSQTHRKPYKQEIPTWYRKEELSNEEADAAATGDFIHKNMKELMRELEDP